MPANAVPETISAKATKIAIIELMLAMKYPQSAAVINFQSMRNYPTKEE
jgi:hypothetical protein